MPRLLFAASSEGLQTDGTAVPLLCRIGNQAHALEAEIAAWERQRDATRARIEWMFTTQRDQTTASLSRPRQRVIIAVQKCQMARRFSGAAIAQLGQSQSRQPGVSATSKNPALDLPSLNGYPSAN